MVDEKQEHRLFCGCEKCIADNNGVISFFLTPVMMLGGGGIMWKNFQAYGIDTVMIVPYALGAMIGLMTVLIIIKTFNFTLKYLERRNGNGE